jgi:ketosteroid isomerase-like protein
MTRLKPVPPTTFGSADEIEQQFYDALQSADIERLMAVWSDDDDISCVNPGGGRLVGIAAIRASFEAMLAQGGLDITVQHVRSVETHSSAVHSVVECIRVKTPDGMQAAFVVATNVYLHTAQGWRLVVHHASPGAARDDRDTVEAAATLH